MFRFYFARIGNQARVRVRRAYANDVSNLFSEGGGEAGKAFRTIDEGWF